MTRSASFAPSLFEETTRCVPQTEGIKYAGSKLKLLPHILQLAQKTGAKTVLDGFSGTTRVAQAFAQSGYRVIANDISVWSEVFGRCYLINSYPAAHYLPMLEHLNALPGKSGWFTQHYGGEANSVSVEIEALKKPWQKHNTVKLDAIRDEIQTMGLSEVEKSVLLTSLIRALDEVDNTLGHFASYLREWSPRSHKTMQLKMPRLLPKCAEHEVHRGDIFDSLPGVTAELAYYDPPYGSNNDKMPPSRVRYGAYYHVWTSVCLNDLPPVFGKAARRTDTADTISASAFEEFRKNEAGGFIAVDVIRRMLQNTKARHIILSYSSGGRATAQELQDAIASAGELREVLEIDFRQNVMSGMRWTQEWVREAEKSHREFLFLIEK